MTLLVTVETSDITQVFESPIKSTDKVGSIDLDGWNRTRVFQARLCSLCQEFK